jgi:hypothetical protein
MSGFVCYDIKIRLNRMEAQADQHTDLMIFCGKKRMELFSARSIRDSACNSFFRRFSGLNRTFNIFPLSTSALRRQAPGG